MLEGLKGLACSAKGHAFLYPLGWPAKEMLAIIPAVNRYFFDQRRKGDVKREELSPLFM